MKTGDLVRVKFTPEGILGNHPNKFWAHEFPEDNFGIVIETAENACKVIFPASDGDIRTFLKSSLEIVYDTKTKTA